MLGEIFPPVDKRPGLVSGLSNTVSFFLFSILNNKKCDDQLGVLPMNAITLLEAITNKLFVFQFCSINPCNSHLFLKSSLTKIVNPEFILFQVYYET